MFKLIELEVMVQEDKKFFSKGYFDNSDGNSANYNCNFLTVVKMPL